MKKFKFLSALAVTAIPVSLIVTGCTPTHEEEEDVVGDIYRNINIDEGWTFKLNDAEEEQDINLPHDFSIIQDFKHTIREFIDRKSSGTTGFLPGGIGYYHKDLVLPKNDNATVILNFDGAYNDTIVSVNGQIVGNNKYGYNPFAFDISKYVVADDKTVNQIDVICKHEYITSSRWYPGSGIYRDVKVSVLNKIHVTNNGTYVTTPNLKEEYEAGQDATVNIDVDVQNSYDKAKTVFVKNRVVDYDGNPVTEWVSTEAENINANETHTFQVQEKLKVNNPKLWSDKSPNLYYVETQVVSGDNVYDQYKTRFGFRYFEFDEQGFHVNGEPTKIHGVCLHHDQGALGAAAYDDAIYRQLSIMKEMGANAVRTSHNCPDEDFLRMCDELGLYVMDEAFDGWEFAKTQHDFSDVWKQQIGYGNQLIDAAPDMEWNEFVMRSMVKRDRNCPSIFMWSLGNELHEGPYHDDDITPEEKAAIKSEMLAYAHKLENITHELDYDSTYWENTKRWWGIALEYDPYLQEPDQRQPKCAIGMELYEDGGLLGYNYADEAQIKRAIDNGTKRLFGSETASANNSRGMYATIAGDDEQENYLVTSYDTAGRHMASECLYRTLYYDRYAGQFVWTGFDYIGEPSPWCWNCEGKEGLKPILDDKGKIKWPYPNSSYYGIVDTCGFPKDSYYLYHAHLKDNDQDKKTLHLVGSFNGENMYKDNEGYTPVDVYTNAPYVVIKDKEGKGAKTLATITKKGAESYLKVKDAYNIYEPKVESTDDVKVDASRKAKSHDLYASLLVKTENVKELHAEAYTDSSCKQQITDTVGLSDLEPKVSGGTNIVAYSDKETLKGDGKSLAYITVDLIDDNENIITDFKTQQNIEVTWSGAGKVLGVDNGYQATDEKWQNPNIFHPEEKTATIKTYAGKALIIVCSDKLEPEAAGEITLTITNKDTLEQQIIKIQVA